MHLKVHALYVFIQARPLLLLDLVSSSLVVKCVHLPLVTVQNEACWMESARTATGGSR